MSRNSALFNFTHALLAAVVLVSAWLFILDLQFSLGIAGGIPYTLGVEDDGRGFPESKENGDGMGVRIMNFRAQMIGGSLEINSTTGGGTEIICRMPLANN